MAARERVAVAGRRCAVWGIVLVAAVPVFYVLTTWVFSPFSFGSGPLEAGWWSSGRPYVLMFFTQVVAIVQMVALPLGAALIGAGIVLRVLAPREEPVASAPEGPGGSHEVYGDSVRNDGSPA